MTMNANANPPAAVTTATPEPLTAHELSINVSDDSIVDKKIEENVKTSPMRLFLPRLALQTTVESLQTLFSERGGRDIVLKDRDPTNKYAFITFDSGVAEALLKEASLTIDGAVITPEPARTPPGIKGAVAETGKNFEPEKKRAELRSEIGTRKLFLGGLASSTTNAELQAYFSKFGEVSDAVIMSDGKSRKPRGFGFVTFEDAASVTLVTYERFHYIRGRWVDVKPAIPREHMPQLAESPDSVTSVVSGFSQLKVDPNGAGEYAESDEYYMRHGMQYSASSVPNVTHEYVQQPMVGAAGQHQMMGQSMMLPGMHGMAGTLPAMVNGLSYGTPVYSYGVPVYNGVQTMPMPTYNPLPFNPAYAQTRPTMPFGHGVY